MLVGMMTSSGRNLGKLSGRTLFVAAVDAEIARLPQDASVLVTGIGTVPAALAVMEILASARAEGDLPARVVNVGTAGALKDGLDGVYEIGAVTKHDFNLDVISDISRYLLPDAIELETSGKLEVKNLATGDMFVSDTATRDRLAQNWDLCDMEGYAVAAAASRLDVPVTLLKQVSDPANETSVGQWAGVLDRSAQELAAAVEELGLI